MVLRRDKAGIESPELSESAEAQEVEVILPFVRLLPTRHVPDPKFSEGVSKHPRRPARIRKENSNAEKWDHAGICSYSHRGSADCVVCATLPRGKRALRFRGHEH